MTAAVHIGVAGRALERWERHSGGGDKVSERVWPCLSHDE
jgi:hypothetical protein